MKEVKFKVKMGLVPGCADADEVVKLLSCDLMNLCGAPKEKFSRIRTQLNSYRNTLPGRGQAIVNAVIANLKIAEKAFTGSIKGEGYVPRRDHKLTDHGFCRALERMYGLDIIEMKDRVVADIERNGIPVIKDKG